LRKRKAFQSITVRYLITIICSFFFIASLSTNVHAIKLTYVKHLFDITDNFNQPSDIAVSAKGLIYVVDGVNNKIKVFDQNGKLLFKFGKKGSLHGQFNFPLGIDIDASGKVYIADSGNHRIQVFTPAGDYISQIKVPPKDNVPSDPTDVVVNESENRLLVADNDNHYILSYDLSTGKLVSTYGSPGMEKREFRYPFLMASDTSNYIYIVDVINTRVQVLNPDGKFVTIIGGWGVEKGRFFRPKGVAVDTNDRVYVSDGYMGVIQVFQSTGGFYSAIGDRDSKSVKKFVTPTGLFVDSNNRLYVVEMFAGKVSVYSIEGDSD